MRKISPTPFVKKRGGEEEKIYEGKDIIEQLTPEETIQIIDVQLLNDELLLTLSGSESYIWIFDLYMNGFLIDERLKKERYLSDEGKTTYKVNKNRVQNALYEGDKKIYFKHKVSGKNSNEWSYYYRVREEVTCKGSIDKIVWTDSYGRVVYESNDFKKRSFKLTQIQTNKRLRDGYHSYKVFCADPIRELYFVFDTGCEYQGYLDRVSRESYYGRYLSRGMYGKVQK